MKQVNKRLATLFAMLISVIISGCGPTDYKSRIQQEIDEKNPKSNQAFCLKVAQHYRKYSIVEIYIDVYHTEAVDKNISNSSLNSVVQQYRKKPNETQSRLIAFSKAGLIVEAPSQYDVVNNKTTYLYNLTDEGQKQIEFSQHEPYFCFGRFVVDEIVDIKDSQPDENNETFKTITLTYHLDGIPAWAQEESIYSLYASHTDFINLIQGKQITGKQVYQKGLFGKLNLWEWTRGSRYLL